MLIIDSDDVGHVAGVNGPLLLLGVGPNGLGERRDRDRCEQKESETAHWIKLTEGCRGRFEDVDGGCAEGEVQLPCLPRETWGRRRLLL